MKYIFVFISIISFCFTLPVWESTGPYGAPLRTVAIAPSNEDIMYVVSYEYGNKKPRCFKSTDSGNSWDEKSMVSESLYVYSLAVDPANPDIVYAGSKKRIYKSTDCGITWTDHLLAEDSILALAIHPTSPSIVFAAGRVPGSGRSKYMGFFKSTDGGVNWTSDTLDTFPGHSRCLALDPSDVDVICVGGEQRYDGTYHPKVYRSTDGGSSFADISSDLPDTTHPVHSLCVHPTNSDIVYAGTRYGIYRTTDCGGSWVAAQLCTLVYSIAASPVNPDIAYAGTDKDFVSYYEGYIFKSTDAGASWFKISPEFRGTEMHGLVVKSTDADEVYAANNSGLYKTTNGGTNWFSSSYGIDYARIRCFALAPSLLSTIYADYNPLGMHKTTNYGDSWTHLPEFGTCGDLCAIAVQYTDPDVVLGFESGNA